MPAAIVAAIIAPATMLAPNPRWVCTTLPSLRTALLQPTTRQRQPRSGRRHASQRPDWASWADDPLPKLDDSDVGNWRSDLAGLTASLSGSSEDEADEEPVRDGDGTGDGAWPRERAYLVGVQLKQAAGRRGAAHYSIHESLDELERLAVTAGLEVVGRTWQQLDAVSPRTYIGSGKVAELAAAVAATRAETVVFDDELSPGQLRALERALGGGVRLCDRTALILDIFSQRAATHEGKLQVELAQCEYQLPRLTRMWTHLERQSGAGQVKGMGEKQIEVDKRLLRSRMALLRRDLEEVRTHRKQYRQRRADAPIPVVALVGYTNAGKSTLLNRLTAAGVMAEDKLFATLDPTTRRAALPSGKEVLFTDTVGFIQKLPTQLVAAFRATLEEIGDASLLLHVVDVSAPTASAQAQAVDAVLEGLDVGGVPVLHVWNKLDACAEPSVVAAVAAARPNTVCCSAATGEGVDGLLKAVSGALEAQMVPLAVLLPYGAGDVLDEIHRQGILHSEQYTAEGTRVCAAVPRPLAGRLQRLHGATIVDGFGDGSSAAAVAAPAGAGADG